MSRACTLLLLVGALIPAGAAGAAERGIVIRSGDIKTQPYLDATTAAPVAANDPVAIIDRKGGWMQVQVAGKTGWMRMLNVRLAASDGSVAQKSSLAAGAALLRTGSSGKTVTTGVKGLGEEDLRNASVNPAELGKLDGLAVDPAQASAMAAKNGLRESQLEYLAKGAKK
jgi:hypothetical protein